MKPDNENYKKLIRLLKDSEPVLNNPGDIEREVIRRISSKRPFGSLVSDALEFLFGWVYIGWIRRTLITASLALVFVFIYQQAAILKRIDFLSRHTIVIDKNSLPGYTSEIERLLTDYRNSSLRFSKGDITFSEKQINELFDTINKLQVKYKDLESLIESDPELKKMIEKKLLDKGHSKNKL
jgi:hypothetical protein